MDLGNFYNGNSFDVHYYLGAHYKKGEGTTFRTYAPAAERVCLIGEFSDWREREMNRCENGQFWEVTVPDAAPGHMYKYRIYHGGSFVDHCDPYGVDYRMHACGKSYLHYKNPRGFQKSGPRQRHRGRTECDYLHRQRALALCHCASCRKRRLEQGCYALVGAGCTQCNSVQCGTKKME